MTRGVARTKACSRSRSFRSALYGLGKRCFAKSPLTKASAKVRSFTAALWGSPCQYRSARAAVSARVGDAILRLQTHQADTITMSASGPEGGRGAGLTDVKGRSSGRPAQ